MVQHYWMVELAMLVFVAGIALWRGRPVERAITSIYLVCVVLSPIVENMHARHGVNVPILAVDAAVALGFTYVAVRYAHWWAICAGGAAVFELLVHTAMIAKTGIPIHAYYVALEIASDLMILAIGVGAVLALRARRQALLV